MLYQLAQSSEEATLRKQGLLTFLQGLNDEDRGVQGFVAGRMQAFTKEDYNEEMHNLLLQKLNPSVYKLTVNNPLTYGQWQLTRGGAALKFRTES